MSSKVCERVLLPSVARLRTVYLARESLSLSSTSYTSCSRHHHHHHRHHHRTAAYACCAYVHSRVRSVQNPATSRQRLSYSAVFLAVRVTQWPYARSQCRCDRLADMGRFTGRRLLSLLMFAAVITASRAASLAVNIGRSASLQPQHISFIPPGVGPCRIEVVTKDPMSERVGTLRPPVSAS